MSVARELARWAHDYVPSPSDLSLAERSLRHTVGVALAGAERPVVGYAQELHRVGTWATAAHVLDFLHLPSTARLSAVIVPVAAATNGGARGYLAGAGVMSRIGTMLGKWIPSTEP